MAESILICPSDNCGLVMARQSVVDIPNQAGTFAVYECPGCHKRAGLTFQQQGGMTAEAASWVESELRSSGFFFPSDFNGTSDFSGGGRFGR